VPKRAGDGNRTRVLSLGSCQSRTLANDHDALWLVRGAV